MLKNAFNDTVHIITDIDNLLKYLEVTVISSDLLNPFKLEAKCSVKKIFSIRSSNVLSKEDLENIWKISAVRGIILVRTVSFNLPIHHQNNHFKVILNTYHVKPFFFLVSSFNVI